MDKEAYKDWDVYHLINSGFISHYHLSERKIKALRSSGLNAWLLSFVEKELYLDREFEYKSLEVKGYLKIFLIKKKFFLIFNLFLFAFFNIVKGRKLVFHILKVDSTGLFILKKLPYFNKRLKVIQEFEGDVASEYSYSSEYIEYPKPPEKPFKIKNRVKYNLFLYREKVRVSTADALILMSEEHAELVKSRVKKVFSIFVLPTLPEERRVYFDSISREEIRSSLGLHNKKVFIYTGNTVCKWQRLEGMCKVISELYALDKDVFFLLLVSSNSLTLSRNMIKKYDLCKITYIDNVQSGLIYKYMSAADIALYLRHNHVMNSIVTSGKLGEYLATGLPVLTTGANASILNRYMRSNNLAIRISDDLVVTGGLIENIRLKIENTSKLSNRYFLQNNFYFDFDMDQLLFEEYPEFVKRTIVTEF